MKKRTGAQSAMAELLSKSNETQIKDPRITRRQPAAAKAMPNASKSQQTPSVKPQITEKNSMDAKRTAPQNIRKHPVEMREKAVRKTSVAPSANENASVLRKASVNRTIISQNVQNVQRTNAPSSKPHVRYAPPMKGSAPRRSKKKDPIKSLVAFAAVAVVAVVCIVAVSVIVSLSDNKVIIPDVYGGAASVTVSASARNIELAASTEYSERHLVTVEVFEGEAVLCSTGLTTVGDVLESMDVEISADHVLRENEDDVIDADSVISYDKITYDTVTETASVPYETSYVDVQNIPKGSTKTVRNGVNGVSTATYKITYVNGVESERVLESQVITTQPTNRIVNRGVGGTVTVGGKTYNYSYYIDCKTTVYTGGGTTASGRPANESVIAVDPSVIPLGTQVYVADSYCYVGIRTAADTGGSIKGNFIDIYFSEDNPNLWGYGVRSARVYILE